MRWNRSRNDPSLENKFGGLDLGLLWAGAGAGDAEPLAGVPGAGDAGEGEAEWDAMSV